MYEPKAMTDTKHEPDCPLHPNWTDETLVRGLKSCTCGADKPVDVKKLTPAEIAHRRATCRYACVLECATVCGGYSPRDAKPTPPLPTEAKVREAREAEYRRQAVAEVKRVQGNVNALRAYNARLVEEVATLQTAVAHKKECLGPDCSYCYSLDIQEKVIVARDAQNAAQAEQIKRLREVLGIIANGSGYASIIAFEALKEASK
jgi:hypothetical protein